MNFKIDENLPAEIATDLRAQGYEAETVVQEGLRGARDPIVLEKVRHEGRAFLTMIRASQTCGRIRRIGMPVWFCSGHAAPDEGWCWPLSAAICLRCYRLTWQDASSLSPSAEFAFVEILP